LAKVQRKKKKPARLVLGVNSGTSVDALDIGLFRITARDGLYPVKSINQAIYKFPSKLHQALWDLISSRKATIEELIKADRLFSFFIASKIKSALRKFETTPEGIDIIGCHGQTIRHLPKDKATLQIGDPSIIAASTGITTVGDFRRADIGAGGEGAPLSPVVHNYLFPKDRPLGVLNIGGIANLTYLPGKTSKRKIFGFDCGPGNILIDALARNYYNRSYDKNGSIASVGRVINKLMGELTSDKFINNPPPKSTGREYYGEQFIKNHFGNGNKRADLITTATEFTAQAIALNVRKYIPTDAKRLIVCGGGAFNGNLMERLRSNLDGYSIRDSSEYGLNPKYVECAGFALLAVLAIDGVKSDLCSTTGSLRPTVLGKICYA